MKVKEILALIPDELLGQLARDTSVDFYAKKLKGKIIFKLLLFSVLAYKDNSLRRMESLYESLIDPAEGSSGIRISSLSERLSHIRVDFFKRIYEKCVELYGPLIAARPKDVIYYDSTIISLSGKLLQTGYHLKGGDADHLRQLKFTIGYSTIPLVADLYTDSKYTSENVALRETIDNHAVSQKSIRVFDRGISGRKIYDDWVEKGIEFISRIDARSKRQPVTVNELGPTTETSTLMILSDEWVYLFGDKGRKSTFPLRAISALQKESGETLVFITNKTDLSAWEVTEIYRKRWDIETFFKFIKQELNFSHLINRSVNGIEVMLYVTLIASILLVVYKQTNQLRGYKILKQKFLQELEWDTINDIVLYCGGNPQKIQDFRRRDKT